MATGFRKKTDENLKALRELVTSGAGNRQCFDCGQKGPTYVNMTIGSFVCTRCSGVLRGLTPPHRVKSISMATFTQDEIEFLKTHGNELCAKTWLGLWDPKRAVHQDHREMMIDKYEHKRYFLEPASPLKSLTTAALVNQNGNSYSNNNNNNNNNNNSNSQRHNSGSESSFQLTPPSQQRTNVNGLHKSSSSAISRPQSSNSHQQQQDAFGLNGLNRSLGSSGASTGALSDTSSCASANGFGAEADFVADFGTANIFDATNKTSPAAISSSASSLASSSNGYAKIQPIRAAHLLNGQNLNHQHANGSAANENFADFDHAPIFTPIGLTPNGASKSANAFSSTNNNNNHNKLTPAEDRYAALKDLDEQVRESKAVAAAAAAASVAVDSFGNPLVNNNNSMHNGSSSSGNINPFSSQQQQSQQQQQQQQQVNPFQAQQQHQQQQQQQQNLFGQMTLMAAASANGYVAAPAAVATPQGFYNYSNGYNGIVAGNNNVGGSMFPVAMMAATPTLAAVSGPNGCGFGFGAMQQQIAATGGMTMGGAAFNNPFAATGVNTNNPFL